MISEAMLMQQRRNDLAQDSSSILLTFRERNNACSAQFPRTAIQFSNEGESCCSRNNRDWLQ